MRESPKPLSSSVAVSAKTVKKPSKAGMLLCMHAGIVLLAVGVYYFKVPNGFMTGGVSGVATALGSLVPVYSVATWLFIINVLMLLIGFLFLGKETGLKTVYCSLAYVALTKLFEIVTPLDAPLTDQPFLELCYAMLLTGLGSALLFYASASSGGTDITALILKKYTRIDVGKSLLICDTLIAAGSFFVFGVRAGLFSMLGLFAKAFLIDGVIESLNSFKYFIVITDKHDEIAAFIMRSLHHGVTSVEGKGDFTGTDKTMIHTVCRRIEAIRLKKRIAEIDPHAFTIISTTSDIIGRGFRSV